MPIPTSVNSYVNTVKMSGQKYLLVEGRDDKHFLLCLAQRLGFTGKVRIEAFADRIAFNPSQDNVKEKIEEIERLIRLKGESVSTRFIALVDRQFDGFSISNSLIRENFQARYYRLVRTRGHSIENYLFDYSLIEDQLRRYYNYDDPNGFRDDALNNMAENLPEVVNVACALSLAARDSSFIGRIGDALKGLNESVIIQDDWAIMDFDYERSPAIFLKEDVFQAHVESLYSDRISRQKIRRVITDYQLYLRIVRKSENSALVRWLCHGHIGMEMIKHTFAASILHSWKCRGSESNNPIHNIENMMFSPWIDHLVDHEHYWVLHYCSGATGTPSPARCFTDLEL